MALSELAVILRLLLVALVVILVVLLVVMLVKIRRNTLREQKADTVVPTVSEEELEDENTSPDALPEDGWLKMARELFDDGKYRLGVRALFLATLSQLSRADFIKVARYKSNFEYRAEVARRAHAHPEALHCFEDTTVQYESVWYGDHDPSAPQLRESLMQNLEALRACCK